MVDASEVAFVAVFLASEKAGAVSGELLKPRLRRGV
jgi:enoyl-[acyl-carrier-protein] reductase (NADH)